MPVDTSAPLRDIVEEYRGKNADELYNELGKIPFFMNEYQEGEEENMQIEALRAMAYEGESWEIAANFKEQGNQCFKEKKYKDAIAFYTQALDQKTDHQDINIACLGNRAQCNIELKNFRRAITDCTRVLDIDPANVKGWYRSAKAFYLLDKMDESIACIERGLEVDKDNNLLKELLASAEKRKARQEEIAAAEQRRKEEAQRKKDTLATALSQRNLQLKYGVSNYARSNPGDAKPHLEDPLDPNSTLYLPVIILYPKVLDSDVLQSVDESVSIEEILSQLFAEPQEWMRKDNVKMEDVDVFAQTSSGGLAKIGKKTILGKAFGAPNVIMIDNMARLYVLSKKDVPDFLKDWKKDSQKSLLTD